jgi:Coenzyme PQQ synthesis protein D (PqqD)
MLVLQTISESAKLGVVSHQIASEVGEEVVILNLKTGVYYGLDPVGLSIWNLLQSTQTFAQLRQALMAEYQVEQDVCDRDLRVLLQNLEAADLIEVEHVTETV